LPAKPAVLTEHATLAPEFVSVTIWRSTGARWDLECFNDTAQLAGTSASMSGVPSW